MRFGSTGELECIVSFMEKFNQETIKIHWESMLTKACKGCYGSKESKEVPLFVIVILPTVRRMDLRELGREPEIPVKTVL